MQFSDFVAEFMHGLCILELFYAFPNDPSKYAKAYLNLNVIIVCFTAYS